MTDRERLIEILKLGSCPSPYLCDENCKYANLERCYEERTADLLLEHGVIVLSCKVGDTVYHVFPKKGIQTNTVRQIRIGSCGMNIFDFNGFFEPSDFGKTVFLTREEAEKALKERDGA